MSIKSLNIRAKTGASVVAVLRNGERNRNPGADWIFEIGDEAEIIGNPKELAEVKDLLGVISAG
jgi:K+/H+ antiporter YhaU regulatory subunit KhtT